VDDNESIRTFLAPFFKLAGLPVEIIELALERFKARPYACSMLLTDCEMPGMTGLEPAKRIRRERADLPMMIFSTSVTVLGPAKFLSAGFSAVLSTRQAPLHEP
jgi:CheY-like chemotaxis protein